MENRRTSHEEIVNDRSGPWLFNSVVSFIVSIIIICIQYYAEVQESGKDFWYLLIEHAKEGTIYPYIFSFVFTIPLVYIVTSNTISLLVKCFSSSVTPLIRRRNKGLSGAIFVLFITFMICSINQEWYTVKFTPITLESLNLKSINLFYFIIIWAISAFVSFIIILYINVEFIGLVFNSLVVYSVIILFFVLIQVYMISGILGAFFSVCVNMFLTEETKTKIKRIFRFWSFSSHPSSQKYEYANRNKEHFSGESVPYSYVVDQEEEGKQRDSGTPDAPVFNRTFKKE